jgi:predicted nucleic acid-binding protein
MTNSNSGSAGYAVLYDASTLVKVSVDEDGSDKVRTHFNESPTKYTTQFCFYETLGVLKVKCRNGQISRPKYIESVSKLTAWAVASLA